MRVTQCLFAIFLCTLSQLKANPQGFELVSGEAAPPVANGDTMTIQSGKQAIVRWNSFSIGETEKVIFQQAGPESAILNRVTGFENSQLLGQLFSNGHVYALPTCDWGVKFC